ncbi:MAG TPA: hypothetical protein VEY71_01545, partial [Chitinophagales bacterium]|nr:hypothetical protein [Chitinophagales bacterium]
MYVELPLGEAGAAIAGSELTLAKATGFYKTLASSSSSTFVCCYRVTKDEGIFQQGDEVIVFDTLLEIGQWRVNDIRDLERLAVQFTQADKMAPLVYAMRADFPLVPHNMSLFFERPRCLCIYERAYEEMKLNWRAVKFLQDIRWWLKATGEGNLHQDDQALEPFFLLHHGYILLPSDTRDSQLNVYRVDSRNNMHYFVATREKLDDAPPTRFTLVTLRLNRRNHGVLGVTPRNFWELQDVLLGNGDDLSAMLKSKLIDERRLLEPTNKALLESSLILHLEMPKRDGETAVMDHFAFLSDDKLATLGEKLNYWERHNGNVGMLIPPVAPERSKAEAATIFLLLPQFPLTKDAASGYSNVATDVDRNTRIVL